MPDVRQVVKEDTYVDDILTGVDKPSEVAPLVDNIVRVLCKGGFELAPWISNHSELLTGTDAASMDKVELNLGGNSAPSQTLGVFGSHFEMS